MAYYMTYRTDGRGTGLGVHANKCDRVQRFWEGVNIGRFGGQVREAGQDFRLLHKLFGLFCVVLASL